MIFKCIYFYINLYKYIRNWCSNGVAEKSLNMNTVMWFEIKNINSLSEKM